MTQGENDKSSNVQQCLERLVEEGQKSEALAILIGAIAHDFRNHLTVIQCWSDVLMRPGALLREKAVGYVQHIRAASARATQLTEQLMAFSNPQHANPKVVNLDEVIGDIVKLAEGAVDENIRLRVVGCSDMDKVRLDFGQFQQALLNAILNARDAIPQGGEITVQCSNISVDERDATKPAGAALGENVRVTVTSIENEPGKGTAIEMYLPRVSEREMREVAL